MSKIAWIGTGVMGASMVKYLAAAGHELRLFNRTKAKAERARANMADVSKVTVCDDIKTAVKGADFVFSIVGYPKDVQEIMLEPDGILANVEPGTVVVDMTTSSPQLAIQLYEEGKKLGVDVLDAPVSGGDKGAKEGTLTIMVGGDEDVFAKTRPLFDLMGKTVNYLGKAGSGQHCKAANQIAVAGATAAYTEALVYALKVGLDPDKMLAAVGGGSAASWQLTNMAPRALAGDFAPGFYVKHFVKDMLIAKTEIEQRGSSLKMLDAVLETYQEFAAEGHAEEGTQALIKYYLAAEEFLAKDTNDTDAANVTDGQRESSQEILEDEK